jgi:phosphate-selective porin OprO and OprP
MKRHRMKQHCLFAVFAAAALVAWPAPAPAQDRRGLTWHDRPRIVFGDDIHVDIRGRVQADWRRFDPDVDEDTFDLRTLRLGLKGDLTKHFDWEIERAIEQLADVPGAEKKWRFGQWKDVFVNWTTFDAFSVKAGRFKMPFGLEQNTGVSDLDFAYRSLGSTKIAPGRDKGVMAYGDLLHGSLIYEAGAFDDDGDNGELQEPQFVEEGQDLEDIGPSFAFRAVGEVFRRLPVPDRLKGAELGIAYTNAKVPEGLNSLRGEDVWGFDFFEPVYVKGRRQRLGMQFDWSPGPTGFRAEWFQSREERVGQSNRNADLSDFIGTAWYASATWFVTGEEKDSNIGIRKPLFQGGIGAIELGVRYEQLTFESASTSGTAFTNPRADHLVPNSDRVLTFGANWMWNRWVKVVANGIRQSYEDANRVPLAGQTAFWSGLVRMQVVF